MLRLHLRANRTQPSAREGESEKPGDEHGFRMCGLVAPTAPLGFRMNSSLDVGLDFQTASRCLVVVLVEPASFDVRFDFHTCPFPYGC
jgi:hypothetical protein